MRRFLLASLMGSVLALAGCTMPGAPSDDSRIETRAGDRAQPKTAPAPRTTPAPSPALPVRAVATGPDTSVAAPRVPRMSQPLPPEQVDNRGASAPSTSCRTSADCAVKNVGSCCGAMPACVNRNASTDPAGVQAQCQREGMSSTCGFKEIQSCACVAGTCQDAGAGGAVDR